MCILCSPTPRVTWRRIGASELPREASLESFGQELVIYNINYEDAGQYECTGKNTETGFPATKVFTVTVECKALTVFVKLNCFLKLCHADQITRELHEP